MQAPQSQKHRPLPHSDHALAAAAAASCHNRRGDADNQAPVLQQVRPLPHSFGLLLLLSLPLQQAASPAPPPCAPGP
jgi:hypothetical protein